MSARQGFEKGVRLSAQEASNTPGSVTTAVDGTSNAITQIVMTKRNTEVFEYGIIHQVLPMNNKVRVSAYRIKRSDYVPEDMEHDIGHDDTRMFNTFGFEQPSTLALPTFIPLINVDLGIDAVDLKSLIGKKVKLKMISENVAIQAELVSETPTDAIHKSGIKLKDIQEAKDLELPLEAFLLSIGYDKGLVEDFFKLKLEDYPESGVLRFTDEAYWDKDVGGPKDYDLFIREEDMPLGMIGRNYTQMKEKLCHMPLIMFSGK